MSTEVKAKFAQVLNLLEQQVLDWLLRHLPPGYAVRMRPEQLKFEMGGVPYRYEPDFEVLAPDGRRLIIEVKSHHSMSLSNMARLAAINRHTKSGGVEFLVLVPDAPSARPSNQMLQEFDGLHISFIHDRSNVVSAVLDTLNKKPS